MKPSGTEKFDRPHALKERKYRDFTAHATALSCTRDIKRRMRRESCASINRRITTSEQQSLVLLHARKITPAMLRIEAQPERHDRLAREPPFRHYPISRGDAAGVAESERGVIDGTTDGFPDIDLGVTTRRQSVGFRT